MTAREAEGVLGPEPESPTPAEVDADVRAELAHHLACASEDLIEQGLAPEEARREAQRRFGDVDAVRRTCVRIRNRGDLMKKRLHLAVTSILAVTLACVFWASHVAREAAQRAALQARAEAERAQELLLQLQRAREPVEHIVLGVGDSVTWSDSYNAEFRGSQKVAADGKILLPSIGWFHVAGLTREQAEADVTAALKTYFTEADVKLMVEPAQQPR